MTKVAIVNESVVFEKEAASHGVVDTVDLFCYNRQARVLRQMLRRTFIYYIQTEEGGRMFYLWATCLLCVLVSHFYNEYLEKKPYLFWLSITGLFAVTCIGLWNYRG